MSTALLGPLVLLALVDSTSFGTLLIPLWLLLSPGRLRVVRVLAFLGTVAGSYLVLGIGLMVGADAVLGPASVALATPVGSTVQLVLGVGLLIWSFFLGDRPAGRDRTAGSGRMLRWRDRAMGDDGAGLGPLIGLAVAAAAVEAASMLPYLGAIGLLTTSDLGWAHRVLVLVGYCLVMVLPALLLLVLRLLVAGRVRPALERVTAWMERSAGETTAWIVGIVGFLIARDALVRVPGLIALLDGLA